MEDKLLKLLIKTAIGTWMENGVSSGVDANEETELDELLQKLITTDKVDEETKKIIKEYYGQSISIFEIEKHDFP